MREVTFKKSIDHGADIIWQVLADFGGFLKWAGEGEIRLEGEGIGMIRHLNMAMGEIAERLESLDQQQRVIEYSLVYGEPLGMKVYRARVQVSVVDVDTCTLDWRGVFEAADPDQEEAVAGMLQLAFGGMTEALAAYQLPINPRGMDA